MVSSDLSIGKPITRGGELVVISEGTPLKNYLTEMHELLWM